MHANSRLMCLIDVFRDVNTAKYHICLICLTIFSSPAGMHVSADSPFQVGAVGGRQQWGRWGGGGEGGGNRG
jgi:hypothetical protein